MSLQAKMLAFMLIMSVVQFSYQQQNDSAFMTSYNTMAVACCQQQGVDKATMDNLFTTNSWPDDDKYNCYYKCMVLKLGLMDESGNVIDDVLKKVSAEFVGTTDDNLIATNCKTVAQGDDLCDTAVTLMKCVRNNSN